MPETAGLVGSGGYTYRLVPDWAKLPAGWTFKDVAAVGVDEQHPVWTSAQP